MCKLQNSYYNQCDRRTFRVTTVCRNRDLPGNKCREATNLYYPGRCGPCSLEEVENENLGAQQANGRFVKPCNLAETSELTHLPALPDSPISSEDEQFLLNAVQHVDPSDALQQLKLTDRFNAPLAPVSLPTFNTVSYTTLLSPQNSNTHKLPQRNSVQSLIDYYNGLDSGYESCDSAPASPSCSPLTSPTTLSLDSWRTILRDHWDPDSIYMRSHTIGRKNASCKVSPVEPKKHKARDDEEEAIDLEEVTCKYGTHKVLEQPGNLPSQELCWWHDKHRGVEERGRACRTYGEDDS